MRLLIVCLVFLAFVVGQSVMADQSQPQPTQKRYLNEQGATTPDVAPPADKPEKVAPPKPEKKAKKKPKKVKKENPAPAPTPEEEKPVTE